MALSATECTDSASSDADPVMAKATNLVTAMPRFAASAARIARRPPDPWPWLLVLMTDHSYAMRAFSSWMAAIGPGSMPSAMARYTVA